MALVYRDYDQPALDRQYNNQAHVPDPVRYLNWYVTESEKARARVKHRAGIAYGGLPDEKLDVFMPADANVADRRPVVVFVHGGAWRNLDRTGSSFGAETFTSRGALYVALGFSRMPGAGSLDEMVAQVRAALAWLYEHIGEHGGDPNRLHVLAHSSGAHLAAMVVCTEWPRLYGLGEQIVSSALLVSGIYDLEPVRLSFRNELLKLDRAAEIRNSPCRNLPATAPALLIAYGEGDTAEFKRQAQQFFLQWQRRHGNAELLELAGLNHYEAIETIIGASTLLTRAACRLFSL